LEFSHFSNFVQELTETGWGGEGRGGGNNFVCTYIKTKMYKIWKSFKDGGKRRGASNVGSGETTRFCPIAE
jgi:hypothetical protein